MKIQKCPKKNFPRSARRFLVWHPNFARPRSRARAAPQGSLHTFWTPLTVLFQAITTSVPGNQKTWCKIFLAPLGKKRPFSHKATWKNAFLTLRHRNDISVKPKTCYGSGTMYCIIPQSFAKNLNKTLLNEPRQNQDFGRKKSGGASRRRFQEYRSEPQPLDCSIAFHLPSAFNNHAEVFREPKKVEKPSRPRYARPRVSPCKLNKKWTSQTHFLQKSESPLTTTHEIRKDQT